MACAPSDLKSHDGVKKCPICEKTFGVTRWKYNCHICGDVVCDDCAKTKIALPPTYPESVKVCDMCKNRIPSGTKTGGGGGRRLGGETAAKGSAEEEREKRANAAAARMAAQSNRGAAGRQGDARNIGPKEDEKFALIARIEELHRAKKTDPPFGLRSFDAAKLRMYLNNMA